jgi:hypothetical protein
MRGFFLSRIAFMRCVSMVERFAIDILRMSQQMVRTESGRSSLAL